MRDMASPVGKTTSVAPRSLNTFHRNPRKGDVAAIAASLKAHDQYKPITANVGTHTGRPNEVLAGNHTLMAIRDLAENYPTDPRWGKVLVHWIDVDDDMCNRIVTADNQTGQLGGFDAEELVSLLEDIGSLEGLGFTDADVDDLRALIEEQEPALPPNPFESGADGGSGEGGEPAGKSGPILDPETGLIAVKDIATNATEYADKTTRLVVMSLTVDQFVWAQEKMTKLRADRGLETNSDLLMALLSEVTGEPAPADADVDSEPEPGE